MLNRFVKIGLTDATIVKLLALAALLAFALLTVWMTARWLLAVLQCGVFAAAGFAP